MYHYIRERQKNFKNLNFLKIKGFKNQINTFKKKFNLIEPSFFLDNLDKSQKYNKSDCILTFDDGYKEHYKIVLPYLLKKKLKAFFFIPSKPILENKVLDVNKIQFILSTNSNHQILLNEIIEILNKLDVKKKFPNVNKLKKNRYDSYNTILIKNLLQRDLKKNIRNKIVEKLFKKYVTTDEADFSSSLYMNFREINDLRNEGMIIGNHTHNHDWLDTLNYNDQIIEINNGLKFLRSLNVDISNWVMGYPYGSYNNNTLKILKKLNCKAAFTTIPSSIKTIKNNYEIPRLDTNDF